MPETEDDQQLPIEQRFLMRVGEVLHALGTPSHRLEALLQRLSLAMGLKAQFLATPTSLIASLGQGRSEQTRLLRVSPGEVNLGKLVELDELLEDVEDRRTDVPTALERLERLIQQPARYGGWTLALAFGLSSAGASVFLGGEGWECVASFAMGLLIFACSWLMGRSPDRIHVNDAWMAFLAGFGALAWNRWVVPVDYSIVTLAALIILIPGLSFTVAMLELATRHLSSGVARLAGAAATMLIIVLGVALAWKLGGAQDTQMGAWILPLGVKRMVMALAPIGFAILFQVRMREWWVVYLAGAMGYFGALLGHELLGADLGPFLGALFVGLVGNSYARIFDRPSSLAHMPGILLIVPGTVGYKALTFFLAADPLQGTEMAFRMTMVGAALVGGLLTATAILPPRRSL
ncbi:MAG: threonine/serine exporter family protein [Planctomycetes bacterium]|nr:threonine/serine exporter family protein [Planctomycetota bacterium]HPF15853.1 threonine/serine exporter family protein [Planctomycetota bacterium]